LSEAFSADCVAVLACCTALGLAIRQHGSKPRIKSLSGAGPLGFMGVCAAGQAEWAYPAEPGRTTVNCNPDGNPGYRSWSPAIPSMRTHGGEVIRGRWGRSLSGGSLSEAFSANSVAALLCCTALGPAIMRHGPKPGVVQCHAVKIRPTGGVVEPLLELPRCADDPQRSSSECKLPAVRITLRSGLSSPAGSAGPVSDPPL
jgi:hypothetical protein